MNTVKVYSYNSDAKKTATKSFTDLPSNATDNNNEYAIELAQGYSEMTDAATSTADLVTTSELEING